MSLASAANLQVSCGVCVARLIAGISRSFRSVCSRNEKVFSSLLNLSRGENQNTIIRASFPCSCVWPLCTYVCMCVYAGSYLPPRLSCAVARTRGMKIFNGAAWSLALLSHHPFRDSRLAKKE